MSTAYLALDVHASTTTFGWMNDEGTYQEETRFRTSGSRMIRAVTQVDATTKKLALEESTLAGWVARTLKDSVDELIVCDPRQNDTISNAIHKADSPDTYELCRLLRLGALQEVYHPSEDRRAIFKSAARHYIDIRDQVKATKQKISAKYLERGITRSTGSSMYSTSGRDHYLQQIEKASIRQQQERLYGLLDTFTQAKQEARAQLLDLGRSYPEIREFRKIPGIGPIGAHLFDAFIQTPHRFPGKSQLFRYCRLGIQKQSSGGDRSAPEGLDIRGIGELKAISHRAWKIATSSQTGENEVQSFYERSRERSNNDTNARLNTQRKIIKTMWGLWKTESSYDPDRFLPPSSASE